ncbi:oxidoreductase family protein [Anaerobacterium chartisolvens]|uniref:Oxidoreductase family protein n=1 Tax=Anaerobacterium chartisolvens TaxID=1297424 RepID=A0A369APF8_9FIRM|nr:Gfo/Idh/MocA family oxidoreductase [Anaerobacterium chartisolvens]RCX09334.1 oxidoreductase family protein [Anaerobacterium chartisolvens]
MDDFIQAPGSIAGTNEIRLAMLGMVDGNGHPYSWSAMFNGFNREEMSKCPYGAIPEYLEKEPPETLRIKGASVTHIWTDDPEDAVKVSKAALIPNVVQSPKDVIGKVDAVIIATDKGNEHVERCRPFVEAGLPIFVDKPLADNIEDLRVFSNWVRNGAKIMSSSCMRYCKEFMPYRRSVNNLGKLCYASISTCKTWERYGIHAVESIYPIMGPGFISVRNTGSADRNIVHLKHSSGADVNVVAINNMYGAFGVMELLGTAGYVQTALSDTFYSFKAQLEAFIKYLTTGIRPFPFSETEELMKIIIAGIASREQEGREIALDEIKI